MNESNILVSIVVPIYCTELYLPACINSLCNQTYEHIQIILVDDQSPDNCSKICDDYAKIDSRIIVIHQENKGVSGARNTGLDHCNGDYIMFVDSDDELCYDGVEKLLQTALNYKADIVSAVSNCVDVNGVVLKTHTDESLTVFDQDKTVLLSLLGDKIADSVWAKIFKADLIKNVRFEEGQSINEDGFYMFQCLMKKPLTVHYNTVVYRYFFRLNSCSRQFFSEKYLSMLYFCNKKKELVAEFFPQYIEHSYNMEVRTHLQFLQVLCRTNDKKYKNTHKDSVRIIRELYRYHKPINNHHKKLAWIVAHGFYPIYKKIIRLKYYR